MNALFYPKYSLAAVLREFFEAEMPENDFECWYEGEQLRLSFSMPGFEKDNISVAATDDSLVVNATKETRRGKREYHREFLLPAGVDSEKSEARYENGVLSVAFPSATHARKIEVK
jgi:HSP20 family protein